MAGSWTVTQSSRVGVRLSGVRLPRRVMQDLPSEGLVRGAIQVPPDSDPVMLLADHPTTGGYPVIAVVHPDDVALVAQTPAGGRVRFAGRTAYGKGPGIPGPFRVPGGAQMSLRWVSPCRTTSIGERASRASNPSRTLRISVAR